MGQDKETYIWIFFAEFTLSAKRLLRFARNGKKQRAQNNMREEGKTGSC